MGGSSSKKPFTQWDLIEFSNITGVPLVTVEKIYKDFQSASGFENKIDKKEFRRLYKEMYLSGQSGNNAAPFLNDHDLDKMSDHVFENYDFDGSGKLTFEEFAEIYLMLTHYKGTGNSNFARNRFNYILDQYDSTPGIITSDYGQNVYNRLNNFNNLTKWNGTGPLGSNPTNDNNWQNHWKQLNDGTGRVSREKFLDYFSNLDEYKNQFNR